MFNHFHLIGFIINQTWGGLLDYITITFQFWGGGRGMVFGTTFKNISIISWQSFLLMEEKGVNHRPVTNHLIQTLSHNVVSSTPRHEWNLNSQL